jgi:hypothetical protein
MKRETQPSGDVRLRRALQRWENEGGQIGRKQQAHGRVPEARKLKTQPRPALSSRSKPARAAKERLAV